MVRSGVMRCLCCGATRDVGALCRSCAHDVAPCDGLIPDHVRSTVPPTDAEAWLVDGFGAAHAVAARSAIGRSHEGEVTVLASSVSREHAELRRADGKDAAWQVRDLGSRNGTFVDGTRCQGRVPLPPRAVLKVGDVALWFLADADHEPLPALSLATASAGGGLVRYQILHAAAELCVVGGGDAAAGGSVLARAAGTEPWKEHALAPLEFQLLRALCARAAEESDSPASVRGCVGTKQLARDLPFQSRYANEENVRQVVRRLRGALAEIGADGVLAVVPGRGYTSRAGHDRRVQSTVNASGVDAGSARARGPRRAARRALRVADVHVERDRGGREPAVDHRERERRQRQHGERPDGGGDGGATQQAAERGRHRPHGIRPAPRARTPDHVNFTRRSAGAARRRA